MDRQRSQEFMQKLVGDVATALATASLVLVGERSGLFAAMAGAGPLTSDALAVAGYVEHDAADGVFTLPDEHAMFLVDPSSEYYLGGLIEGQLELTLDGPADRHGVPAGRGRALRRVRRRAAGRAGGHEPFGV